MEEGRQKSKRLSHMAKFKREVIRCAEEKGNHKAAAIFGVDESYVQLWRKHKAAISECKASRNVQLLQKSRGGCRLHGKPSRRALSSDLSRSVA
jgi:transposase-like protein